VTWERKLPKGMVVQTSYIGRVAHNLLASRDVMMPNNLTDPRSGMDWYTAAGMLEDYRRAGTPINQIPAIPFFENLFGGTPNFARNMLGSSRAGLAANATQAVYGDAFIFNANDWTTTQADIDGSLLSGGRGQLFYQPQYGALSSFSTFANSNYHAATLSVRERWGGNYIDFNYTLSKSMDDASGLQTSGGYGSAFVTNPLRQHDNYAVSDFDVRHIVNVNGLWQLPIGRGHRLLRDGNSIAQGVLGGWQLSGIMRWNSGLPISVPFDAATWATNWNVQSWGTRITAFDACVASPNGGAPALFGCNVTQAYQSFRSARPGETGDRNVLRLPGYFVVDMGIGKTFEISERHSLQVRFEAFNVTNTQRMGALVGGRTGYGIVVDPFNAAPPPNWSAFGSIQGERRVMQFGFRYEF
jgi:hypothetical protein